jgi:hypothetical protein
MNTKGIPAIDKLIITYETDSIPTTKYDEHINLDANSFIKYNYRSNQHWHNIDNLYIFNRLIGKIHHNPKTPLIPENKIKIEFDNTLYYNGYLFDTLDYLKNNLGFKFNNISYVEIAYDSIKNNLINFIEKHNTSNKIIRKGRANIEHYIKYDSKLETYYLGSRKSDKHIAVYNKTNELKNSNKAYISNFWTINGLNHTNDEVERFELRMQRKKASNVDLNQLNNPQYLIKILEIETKNYFDFYKISTIKGRQQKIDVTPIKFKANDSIKYTKVKKSTTPNNTHTIKQTIKQLYILNQQTYTDALYKMAIEYNLMGWLKSKQKYWDEEIDKHKKPSLNTMANISNETLEYNFTNEN